MDSRPPQPPVLHVELRIDLRVADEGRQASHAELLGPVEGRAMRFGSLRALIRYLAQLDAISPPRGIR